jgi:hypothetical protein
MGLFYCDEDFLMFGFGGFWAYGFLAFFFRD